MTSGPADPYRFLSIQDACHALLLTTTAVLTAADVEFVVVGGWSPVLLAGGHESLRHPGTNDVDVLLNDKDPVPIQRGVQGFLDLGFLPSAKHPFQLLKQVEVDGGPLVFNVDLLCPRETLRPFDPVADMFTDILDLKIRERRDSLETRFIQSIAFEASGTVLDKKMFTRTPVSGVDLDGAPKAYELPLLGLASFVVSKCQSVRSVKRPRDAFDLYYVLTGRRGQETAAELAQLAGANADVSKHLSDLRSYVCDNEEAFDRNVRRCSEGRLQDVAPGQTLLSRLRSG